MSRSELAREMEYSEEAVRLLEVGKTIPFTATLLDLEEALGVPMESLIDKAEIRRVARATRSKQSRSGRARQS